MTTNKEIETGDVVYENEEKIEAMGKLLNEFSDRFMEMVVYLNHNMQVLKENTRGVNEEDWYQLKK
jgi:hypothetical protein